MHENALITTLVAAIVFAFVVGFIEGFGSDRVERRIRTMPRLPANTSPSNGSGDGRQR